MDAKFIVILGSGIIALLITILYKGIKYGFNKLKLEELISSFLLGIGVLGTIVYGFYSVATYSYLHAMSKDLPQISSSDVIIMFIGILALIYIGIKNYKRILSNEK